MYWHQIVFLSYVLEQLSYFSPKIYFSIRKENPADCKRITLKITAILINYLYSHSKVGLIVLEFDTL